MRKPNRIKHMLKVLEGIWTQYPYLRLGQLLENVTIQAGKPDHCLFYIEDDDLLLDLCAFVGRVPPTEKPKKKKNTELLKRPLWPYKSMEEIEKIIEKKLKTTKRKKRKSKKIRGSGYKFPECLMPGGGKTGYGDD